MLPQPHAHATEASAPYLQRNTLYADKLYARSNTLLNIEAQFDRLPNALNQLIQRARLCMAPGQFWDARDIIPLLVRLNNAAELAFGALSHKDVMPEDGWASKTRNLEDNLTYLTDLSPQARFPGRVLGRSIRSGPVELNRVRDLARVRELYRKYSRSRNPGEYALANR